MFTNPLSNKGKRYACVCELMVITRWCQKPAKQPAFEPVSFITFLTSLFIHVSFLYWQIFFRRVKETNETTNFQAHFFYNVVLYCLTDLPITIVYFYWQLFSFLEYFLQTNVFAYICAFYALLIIVCTIQLIFYATPLLKKSMYKCMR